MDTQTKVKLPKPPVQPGFYHTKPVPPKGQAYSDVVWSFDNDDIDGIALSNLNHKVQQWVDSHNITGEFTADINQTYTSSEYGHCEFELRVHYFNNNPTEAQVKEYEKELERYNNLKEKHDEAMKEYKLKKAAYDVEIAEIQRKQELEMLEKLIKKHGVPSNVTN